MRKRVKCRGDLKPYILPSGQKICIPKEAQETRRTWPSFEQGFNPFVPTGGFLKADSKVPCGSGGKDWFDISVDKVSYCGYRPCAAENKLGYQSGQKLKEAGCLCEKTAGVACNQMSGLGEYEIPSSMKLGLVALAAFLLLRK